MFIYYKIAFPYIHDLGRLLTLLEGHGVKIPKYIRQASRLTRFAVESRYPGLSGPVTKRHYNQVIRIAAKTLQWAQRQIK